MLRAVGLGEAFADPVLGMIHVEGMRVQGELPRDFPIAEVVGEFVFVATPEGPQA